MQDNVSNINGLHGSLDELAVSAAHFDSVLYCETKATRLRHAADRIERNKINTTK